VTEPLLATFQQWLLFSGVVLAVGCVAWRLVVLERVSRAMPDSVAPHLATIERSVASAGVVAGLALIVAWILRMVAQVMGFRDPFVPLWDDVSFLLFETFWGTVWMVQGALLPFVVAAFAWARTGSPAAWRAAGVLSLGLVATLALASHAMGVEPAKALFVTADAVHALAAGCWVGSLGVIVSVGRPIGSSDEARALFAAQLRAFSPMAMVSVAALIAMGSALSWAHLAGLSNLWETGYGRVLMAKVALAGGVFLAGFVNWRLGLPASGTSAGAVSVHRRAALEVALAVGVLLITAVLVRSSKP
jgi:copper transport protein